MADQCEGRDRFQDFGDFVRQATGHAPYPYQARLAAEGLPDLLQAPTGAGKTVAAVLPWLHRRLVTDPDRTPRRLVYVLPARSLADRTADRIREWLDRLGLADEVGLHLLAGGSVQDGSWRRHPERTAILVGTQDLLLSRALMRGFADNRRMAAVSYGLLHNDAQWVFDELHLFGPALATGVRLQRLRERLGTAAPTHTLWMSSTWDANGPNEPDGRVLRVRAGAGGARRVRRLDLAPDRYVERLVRALLAAHVPGTRTVAVLNTVERARAVHRALTAERPAVLLHPYVRPGDRPEPAELTVTTGTVEAGLDLSCRTLLTELAPWSSLVQRAGRCNRHGEYPGGGDLLWCVPPEGGGQPAAEQWLDAREGEPVTAEQLFDARIAEHREPVDGLERAELLALFDTSAEPAAKVTPWSARRRTRRRSSPGAPGLPRRPGRPLGRPPRSPLGSPPKTSPIRDAPSSAPCRSPSWRRCSPTAAAGCATSWTATGGAPLPRTCGPARPSCWTPRAGATSRQRAGRPPVRHPSRWPTARPHRPGSSPAPHGSASTST